MGGASVWTLPPNRSTVAGSRDYLFVAARWVALKLYVSVEVNPWKVLPAPEGSVSVSFRWSGPEGAVIRSVRFDRASAEPITALDARTAVVVPPQVYV